MLVLQSFTGGLGRYHKFSIKKLERVTTSSMEILAIAENLEIEYEQNKFFVTKWRVGVNK